MGKRGGRIGTGRKSSSTYQQTHVGEEKRQYVGKKGLGGSLCRSQLKRLGHRNTSPEMTGRQSKKNGEKGGTTEASPKVKSKT